MRHYRLAFLVIAACKGPTATTADPDSGVDGEAVSVDAAMQLDAAPDGAPDAMPDAAPDAMPDAAPDAMPPMIESRSQLAVGAWQSCVIRGDGTLWCWGTRDRTLATSVSVPTQIGVSTQWTTISLNESHACGIDGGALYCWGRNSSAALGTGDMVTRTEPTQIGVDTDWVAVSAGALHTCGIRAGALYCWGTSSSGEAGAGSVLMTPTQLGTATDWTAVAAGVEMTCGLRGTAGPSTLWCWGDGDDGAIGNGAETDAAIPTQVGTATDWIAITAYSRNACGRRADGTAWCWGNGFMKAPTQIGTTSDYTAMVPGMSLACGVHAGTLSCRGHLSMIGAGDGTQIRRTAFVDIGAGHSWRTVAASSTHACALDDSGMVACFGRNGYSALGLGTRAQHLDREQVGTGSWSSVSVSTFYALSCGLSGDSAFCWGGPGPFQGNGSGYASQVPTLVGSGFAKLVSGFNAACGIKTDGSLWCWGDKRTLGLSTDAATPVQIGTATDWSTIAVNQSTCGIRAGALYCWGNNFYGQLGDGTTTYRSSPTQVGAATDWTAVATEQFDTCGIRGGALYCWGTRVNSKTPLQIGTDTDWLTIDVNTNGSQCGMRTGNRWSCAVGTSVYTKPTADWAAVGTLCGVKVDGTLWCYNSQIGTASDWSSFSEASGPSGCGLRANGTLWCAGTGLSGELGFGDAWVLAPTQVAF